MKLSAVVAGVVVLLGLSLSPITKAQVATHPSYLIIGNYKYTCQHACVIKVVNGITIVTDSDGGAVYMDELPPPPGPKDLAQ